MTDSSDLAETQLSGGKVSKILCHLYQKVESLEAFAKGITSSAPSSNAVIQSGDSDSYVSMLKSALVCTPYNARALPQTWLLEQQSHQDEVVLRAIERIRLREGRNSTNLLVIGYRLMSDDADAQISSSWAIEYRIANSNTSRLHYTPWKTLLSRIGDDAMEFLLETRSVFLPATATSTCYVQLTGTPMYELWPFHRYYAQNQRNPTTQKMCTSLLNDSKYKAQKRNRHRRSNLKPCLMSKETNASIKQPYVPNESVSKTCGAGGLEQEMRAKFNENEHVRTDVEVSDHSADCSKQKYSENVAKKRKAEEVDLNNEPHEKVRIVSEPVSTDDNECVVRLEGNFALSSKEYPLLQSQLHKTAQVAGPSQQSSSAHCRNQKRRRKRKGKLSDDNRKEHKLKAMAFENRLLIERTPMFFSRDLREKYPPMYVQFDSDMNSPLKLVSDILAVRILYYNKSSSVSCGDVECCSKVKDKLLNIVKLICRNHQACRYKYLLRHHCGLANSSDEAAEKQTCEKGSSSLNTKSTPKLHVPVYVRGEKPCSSGSFISPHVSQERAQPSKKSSVYMSVCHLLKQHCSRRSVFLFARACSLRILPTELFGSAANRNKFFQNLRKVVRMSRYEQLPLGYLMKSMKVTHCRWMKEVGSNTERLKLLAKVLSWLMTAFVLPLIKSYFYVTDSATYRNRMFYYRKSLWKKIHQKGLTNYMQQGTLRKISPEEAKQKILSGATLGFASLRFMPKSSSLRPIINLSKKTKISGTGSHELSVNWQLIDLQNVLVYERQLCPSIVGTSVSSLDDIYAKWKKFVIGRHTRGDSRPLYFVKVDIENCYDSINQQKLYDTMSTVLQGDYVIRRYVSVMEAGGRLRRTYHRDATSLTDLQPSFVRFVKDRIEDRGAHDAFFVDQVLHAYEDASSLLRKLKLHLFHSIVKVGRRYFLQSQGIAQGSAVSSLLCNIYYGKMEASYITICEETELLMRQVDDFLYVTPSYENAVSFLTLMLRGIPEYNCHVNRRKTLVNFDLDSLEVDDSGADAVPRLATGTLFPWCGLLIDTATLAVVADYTRYAGIAMSDTLTVDLAPNAGRAMRNKLMFSLRARCHRIFFDGGVNPAAVQNVYRVFLLAAFKLHAHAAHLTSGPQRNPAFFVDLVFEVARFVSNCTNGLATTDGGLMEGPALQWLCLEAFCRKLGLHGGVYGAVLSVISRRQMSLRRQLDERRLVELARIVGDNLPADFQCMLP